MRPIEEKKKREKEEAERQHVSRAWAILLFGFIGATATTFAVSQLRRSADWFYIQFNKSQSNSSWKTSHSRTSWGSYREEAWKRYNRRLQEEYEEEMERVERIRHMQSVFNRERNKYKRSYEGWREYGPGSYQRVPRDDWYWQSDTSYRDSRTDYRSSPINNGNYSMSRHYSVLGLDRSRAKPYSEAEIKTAFRAKAMEYHPDQNQDNKEAESKFKEVMASYEAIKLEMKNSRC
ncbi:uncharacterized protein M6B38_195085 [Iris pallida]|uniref:J domain-containing protein n=1 Tax=Iris pallida TaxID=29817 RepID=A0AAX6EDN0_IRIPA|nr:uncharacterized protein M6B38_195085 [Iris pallida]